jgi:transposase
MNSAAMSGASLDYCFRTSHAAFPGWMTGVFSTASSGSYDRARDLPDICGPRTTCYNRFVRWRQAGVWDALAVAHDAAVQMVDTSVGRVHQHGACITGNREQHMGRSRGGLTSKVHAVVDTNGLPVRLGLTRGEAHDIRLSPVLLAGSRPRTMLLADRGTMPTGSGLSSTSRGLGPTFHRSKIARTRSASALTSTRRATWSSGQCRRIATRYDKLAANYLAFIKLASIRIWLRAYESTP